MGPTPFSVGYMPAPVNELTHFKILQWGQRLSALNTRYVYLPIRDTLTGFNGVNAFQRWIRR